MTPVHTRQDYLKGQENGGESGNRVRSIKNLPAMQEPQETWVRSLGQEDPLQKEMTNPLQYSCLRIPMDRGAWWATIHGVAKESDMT